MKLIVIAVLLTAVAILSGCAGALPRPDFADYAISVNKNGDIREQPISSAQSAGAASAVQLQPLVDPEQTEQGQSYRDPIERLFAKAGQSNKDILIFVHGGLNTIGDSTSRTNKLVEAYQGGQLDNYYPILINWDSGLGGSYFEHLFQVRQGEIQKTGIARAFGPLTSPFYLLADLGRGVVRAPMDIFYTTGHDLAPLPGVEEKLNPNIVNADILYKELIRANPDAVSRGRDFNGTGQAVANLAVNVVTWPFQLVMSPLVDGIGTPAWENMQRRAKNLYNKPAEFNIDGKRSEVPRALKGEPASVMSEFGNQLLEFSKHHKVTLAAHSMGTFIVNELVRQFPDIDLDKIVYMAGADSVRDTFNSIVPYLEHHPGTRFYNLSLHPQSEVQENNYFVMPRGSLLVWIDDYFSTPQTFLDRTIGRWENIIQAYGAIPPAVRSRFFIKAFDQDSAIRRHGDFDRACFWEQSFFQPGPTDQDPWPESGGFFDPPDTSQKSDCGSATLTLQVRH